MKIGKEILITFLTVLVIPLTCVGGFADINLGNYTLGGDIEMGGIGVLNNISHVNKGYFEEYLPYPPVFNMEQLNMVLTNKDGSEFYKIFVRNPGIKDQDFYLHFGKIGLYDIELEYDQLQHIYSTVNPTQTEIGILVQRLRLSGTYTPTPEIDVYADYNLLKRTGEMPSSANAGPPNNYAFTSSLAPIDFAQHDLRIGSDYAQPAYQFQLGYHLSLFDDENKDYLANPASATGWESLPPSNMANYINGAGAWDLPQCANTRLTGNFTYGWLSQNDTVFNSSGTTLYPSNFSPAIAGSAIGTANLDASTFTGNLMGVTRPSDKLTVRYSYGAYDFQNGNLSNSVLVNSFYGSNGVNLPLLQMEQYSYLRQAANVGVDWKLNSKAAVDVAYTFDSVDRDYSEGSSITSTPKVQFRYYPCDWVNLMAGYAYSNRSGSDFLEMPSPISNVSALTYKAYSGSDEQHMVNFVAEFFPLNNVTFSTNFNLHTNSYSGSAYGLQSDNGWSAGADVSWTPFKCLSLSVGYAHEENSTKELADNNPTFFVAGTTVSLLGDSGPVLLTTDSYDTVTARADLVLIPNRLTMSTRASYSYSSSDFHNSQFPNLNETLGHLDTFLIYHVDQHWALRLGYTFEQFNMSNAYQTLYDAGLPTGNQSLNVLEGFYRDYTAHIIAGFVQYKF